MFDVYEQRLQALIKKTDTPVLGLLGTLLPNEARSAIQRDVSSLGSVSGYVRRLEQYPALFGVWLAERVMLGLGQDGHFSLYPHVQQALGGLDVSASSDRELLWRAFRRALVRLGIQPLPRMSGSHFMADEYTRQAGVPIAFADDLATRMLGMARRLGLPDEDDQESLLSWQVNLLSKLGPPFSVTARKAVERDHLGYYTRAFIRVYQNGGQASGPDPLEEALAKAFAHSGHTQLKRAAIPQLLYRDGTLGVLFPPAAKPVTYQIRADAQTIPVNVEEHGIFRALPMNLYSEIAVLRSDGERLMSTRLWADSMSNRLLVFNAEGRLKASAQLNQSEPIELAPGQYVALCRFEPTDTEDWLEISDTPRLIEVPLDIRPGEQIRLRNGSAAVKITGHDQPTLCLTGRSKAGLEGIEFWYDGFSASVHIPHEWLNGLSNGFELRISHNHGRASVPVHLDATGYSELSLSAALNGSGIKPGLWRVVLELARTGETRSLQRLSFLVWSGLQSISKELRFDYTSPPTNIITRLCEGIRFGSTRAEPTDDHHRLLRLAFDVGNGRTVHLSLHRPGVFVEVIVPNRDGSATTFPRALGSAETVSLTSDKSVIVSASEPGFICLGDMRLFVDFSKRASRTFPASFLASRIAPGARTLSYQTESGAATVPLLELSQPHLVTEVKTARLSNLLEIKVLVAGEPTALALTGRELSTGQEARAEYEFSSTGWDVNDLARIQVYCAPQGHLHSVHILIDVQSLQPGVWLLGFGARVGGVWGRLQDQDEGRIAVALAVGYEGREQRGIEVIQEAGSLSLGDAVNRLSRLNDHFRHYWSPVCWTQQEWLPSYFSTLVDRIKEHESSYVTELIDMASQRTPEDGRPGFISTQLAPARLNRVFCLRRELYKRVNIKPHPLSVGLRSMAEMHAALAPSFGVLLHPTAAIGFKNVAEVMNGRRPKGFNLDIYRQTLASSSVEAAYRLDEETFLPGASELLGPLHLAHAWREMERLFIQSQLMPSKVKNAAVALAGAAHRHQRVFGQSAPVGLRNTSPVITPQHRPDMEVADPDTALRWEHMEHIAHVCALLAWHCRLEPRKQGELPNLLAALSGYRQQVQVTGPSVTDCIAYYLQIAPALFSFYLLLWELVIASELDPIVQHV